STTSPPTATGPARTAAPAPIAAPPPTAPGPLGAHSPRASGLTSPPRAGGPLSGHTPHRSTSGGGPLRPGSSAASQADLRPNPTSPPPLKRPIERGDYISPTGTRMTQSAGRPGV